MANLNQLTLIGNLTRDPELRYTKSKTPVCNGGIAVNRKWNDDKGNKQEEVCFIDWTAWGKLGELISSHTSKGTPVFMQGHLKQETFDVDGTNRTKLFLVVEQFQFLDQKPKEDK